MIQITVSTLGAGSRTGYAAIVSRKDKPDDEATLAAGRARGRRFLIAFGLGLGLSFLLISLNPVDVAFIQPLTAGIARVAGGLLRIFGEEAVVNGTNVSSPRFSVEIFNGCNGVVSSLVFVCAVLAFPVAWGFRLAGMALGLAMIQLLNMVRILTLFWIGIAAPSIFDAAHVYIWPSVIILSAAGLWLWWAKTAIRESASP